MKRLLIVRIALAVQLIVTFMALSTFAQEEEKEGQQEKISLDLKGIDINELFRILAVKTGLTIVPAKSVSGRVNIFLNNLTFEDALEIILISQDLAAERKGDVINVMTAVEYERLFGKKYNEKKQFQSLKLKYAKPSVVFSALGQIKSDIGKVIVDEGTGTVFLIDVPEKLELMKKTISEMDQVPATEVMDLKYAKPADVKTHLSGAITTGPGELYVDERSSKVMVSDLPDKLKKLKRMVKAFDEEPQQVFIEAEILQISLKKEYQRGINWEKAFGSNFLKDLDFKGTFPVSKAISFTPSPALADSNQKISVGTLSRDNYTTTLQFLETFGDTKILSRPKIAAVNNQEAKIMVGAREAYISSTLSQAQTTTVTSESIQFIDVGVKLNVVPTINKDGYVTMKIKPEISSVRETITTSLGSSVPIVETSEAETVVKVKDGMMIMIGGLMKEEKRSDIAGVPFLSRIPFLGSLFGSQAGSKKNTELIVFITPHIMRGDSMLPGTEPETVFPADIVPEDLQQEIISRKLEGVKEGALEEEAGIKTKDKMKKPSGKKENTSGDIQDKMKGLKEY